jgi:hypothetical protein
VAFQVPCAGSLGQWTRACPIDAVALVDRILAAFGGHQRTWRMRARVRKVRFVVSRRLFGTSYAFEEASARARALPYLLRNAILPVVIALLLVVIIDFVDGAVRDVARDWHWPPVAPSAYEVLLEAVAGVTGVFLALYFTAVSTVAASVYVNVPHDIRALIVRDRLGNLYVAGVAFTMAFSVVLLIARALTGRAYELGPPVVGLLAAFSIFAFIRLGQRAFYLADPTLLANTLAYDFGSWLRRATDSGRRWQDPSFQEHYRQQAHKSVTSLASLLAIASDQPHLRGGSVRQLTSATVGLLVRYLGVRDRVPTKSRWFGERYEHKQWYLTDSTEVDTATATATALQPRAVPDVAWVEDALMGPLVDLAEDDLRRGEYEDAYVVVSQLEPVWTRMGERWAASDVTRWLNQLTARVSARLAASELHPASRPALLPGIWDAVAMLPLAAELGFHRNVTARSVAQLTEQLESKDWSDNRAPYSIGAPRTVIGTLEALRAGRAFEIAVSAPELTRTPNWYVREVALHTYERAFREQINALVSLLASWYPTTANHLAEAKMYDAAGAVLSRGIEAAWKLRLHVAEWEGITSDLRAGPLLVDLVRPNWAWDTTRQNITELRRELLRQLSASIPAHALRDPQSDVPDYLGEAVHRVGEACFETLADDDAELFAQLFPTYFIGVLSVVSRIQGQVADWQTSAATSAIAEPVVDALDLSGYALIYSELHGNPRLWDTCKASWTEYLEDEDGPRRLQIIAAMHNHQRNLFAITHRAIGRTRWQMALNEVLRDLPRVRTTDPFGNEEVRHHSTLIRRIAPDHDLVGSMFQRATSSWCAFCEPSVREVHSISGLRIGSSTRSQLARMTPTMATRGAATDDRAATEALLRSLLSLAPELYAERTRLSASA